MQNIRFNIGFNYKDLKTGAKSPVVWDTNNLINPHVSISGDSGTGKTHTLRSLIEAVIMGSDQPPRIHIMDVHGDLNIPGASEVMFSSGSPYGFNPLQLDPDPHFGGVKKCVENFMSALNRTTNRRLGPRQEAVLRTLMYDLFERSGFELNDPSTWKTAPAGAQDISKIYLETTFADREAVKSAGGRWDAGEKSWWVSKYEGEATKWTAKPAAKPNPTLSSLLGHANQQLRMSYLGTDQRALLLLEEVNKKQSAMFAKFKNSIRDSGSDHQNEKNEDDLQKAKTAAVEAYQCAIDAITSGRELEDVFKYESVDVLKSVIQLLDNLDATGIFRNALPPFAQNAPVWRYNIKALTDEAQMLFVNFRAQQLLADARLRGESEHIRDILIIDEGKRFVSDESDHPLTKIGLEARKFGMGLWIASQSPTHIPLDLYATIGTKIILGIDRLYWKTATSKYGVSEEALAWVSAKKTLLSHMKVSGETSPQWQWVVMPSALEDVA